MKKLSLTLISILCAFIGYSQCSQLNASFTLTQNNPSVTLTRTSTFPTPIGNTMDYFDVNWGDNSTNLIWGPTTTANHTYTTPGVYNIQMVQYWIDSTGNPSTSVYCSDTAYQTVTITVPPCNASISSVNNGGGAYTFTAINLGSGPNTYVWDFGDGSTGTGSPITHTYTTSGSYNVTLVSTGGGCSHTSTQNLNVWTGTLNCASLNASFTTNSSGYTAYFNNTSTYPSNTLPGIVGRKASWDFGDGSAVVNNVNYTSHTYAAAGTYAVTMTNDWYDSLNNSVVLCTDVDVQTITITTPPPPPNFISGSITYDSTLTNTQLSFKVWLIEVGFDSSVMSTTLTAVDSLITPSQWFWANYQFNNVPSGGYFVKARVAPGTTNPGLIPTYHQSSAIWNNATYISHYGGSTANNHIFMISGTPSSGPGFIGGNVSQGAGKGTNAGVANLSVLLRDATNNVIASTYTDVNGDYSFGGIGNGSYTIYPEEMNYATTPSAPIVIGAGVNTYTTVDFEKNSTSIQPKPTAIKDVAVNNVFSLYPNPTKGQVNITWKSNVSGEANVVITDISGRVVYNQAISTKTTQPINLSGMNQGVYFIKINTEKGQYTERIVLQ